MMENIECVPCGPNVSFKRPLVLDGGLATWLESEYKKDLNHHLWSTHTLETEPEVVENAHYDFITKGDCDVVITCTYQSSLEQGFKGDREAFERSIRTACETARKARERSGKQQVLLAGSCGCYGAALANGAEYSGEYGFEGKSDDEVVKALREFHLPRMDVLVGKDNGQRLVDILAAETVPLALEGKVLSSLFKELQMPGYVTFSCRNGTDLNSGEKIRDAVRNLEFSEYLIGVGVNCTPPQHIEELIGEIKSGMGKRGLEDVDCERRPNIVVYPNSGEIYCGKTKTWSPDPAVKGLSFTDLALKWKAAGATWIGGCCRTGCAEIKGVRDHVIKRAE